jgi:tubulin polyglutamylase TTLL1
VKPNNKSQGQGILIDNTGIFLLKKINQLKKIVPGANLNAAFKNFNMNEIYVISRYIDNPLLIGGKKFDLRIYVLVTSYRPIKAYLYDQGFGRFCNELYTSDVAEMDNMFVHLTNVAIQKYSEKYSDKHGGKWSVKCIRFYL